ncbi:MAG: sialidase family protein [Lentisphaeria bacterium]|nr:sialidase family protein [Lentisphaeria bacterium]
MDTEDNAKLKNLLPNASFELDFGQAKHDWVKYNPGEGAADNWTDMFTPLTMKLAVTGQLPDAVPVIEAVDDAPDGARAAAIPVAAGQPGYLTSPIMPLKGGQAYTLSVYARSDVPSANLHLAVWTHTVDLRETPDAQSEPITVNGQWQRYELTFNLASYFHRGLVVLTAGGEADGMLWVDAVQLEEGHRVTPFETRHPVEAHVTADKPFSGMLHLMAEPLEIDLNTYVDREPAEPGDLTLSIETLEGKVVFTRDVPCPTAPGRHTTRLSLDFPLVGNFRARVFTPAGQAIDVSSYGYMFTVHPVMKAGFGWEQCGPEEEDFQGILYSRDGEIHELPAERTRLPLYATEGRWNFTITPDNRIYLMVASAKNNLTNELMRSGDGGRTWDVLQVTRAVHSVLPDGSFLAVDPENDRLVLHRSGDEGRTWQRVGDGPGCFPSGPQHGPVTQLRDGTLVWPIGLARPGVHHVTYVFRSTDGGRTWSQGYPVCPTGEPAVIELASGRLLAVVRNNLPPRPDACEVFFESGHEDPWRLWSMQYGQNMPDNIGSVQKNVLLADSDDGGETWTNVRPGSPLLGEMHGSAVELPDGRIVIMHVHRVPWLHGGERARVSRDGGNTWEPETYYLSTVLTYPEYSTNCVLPPELADGKPGMILTVLGDRPFAVHVERPGLMQAVRWRPLP